MEIDFTGIYTELLKSVVIYVFDIFIYLIDMGLGIVSVFHTFSNVASLSYSSVG